MTAEKSIDFIECHRIGGAANVSGIERISGAAAGIFGAAVGIFGAAVGIFGAAVSTFSVAAFSGTMPISGTGLVSGDVGIFYVL